MVKTELRIHIQYKITDSIDMTLVNDTTQLNEQEKETKSSEQNIYIKLYNERNTKDFLYVFVFSRRMTTFSEVIQNEEEVTNGGNSVVSYTYYGTNPHLHALSK